MKAAQRVQSGRVFPRQERGPGGHAVLDRVEFRVTFPLVCARSGALSSLRERFDWRSDSVVVASKKFHRITYDKLYDDRSTRLKVFSG
jgi:hypothetical protein